MDQVADVGSSNSEDSKLIIRVIVFPGDPTCEAEIDETLQTDWRRTDNVLPFAPRYEFIREPLSTKRVRAKAKRLDNLCL